MFVHIRRVTTQAGGSVRGSKFKQIVRESKFRYISGKALHASTQYTHINDVAKKNTGESNVLQVGHRGDAVRTRPIRRE